MKSQASEKSPSVMPSNYQDPKLSKPIMNAPEVLTSPRDK